MLKSKKGRNFKITLLFLLTISLMIIMLNQSCSSATYNAKDIKMTKIKSSVQYKNDKFHNIVPWNEPSLGEYIGTMWDFLFKRNQRTPNDSLPRMKVNLAKFNTSQSNQLNAAWLGHSSLMINIDGYKILTDPVFEKSVSFFGPTRFNGEVPLDTDKLPEVDLVLISHNHYDHLNKYSIELLKNKSGHFIVPLGVGAELERWGIPREKITELDWWEEYKVADNLFIAAAPTQHFSGRSLTDRNKTLWVSYVIKSSNYNVYFSGDSGYSAGFKEIGNKYGPFDMTFIECGAYNEKWHHIHMYPEETVQAHIDLKGNILHPIHWGTFNLSLHPWFEPMERLTIAAENAGIKIATPIVGGTTELTNLVPNDKWWKVLK